MSIWNTLAFYLQLMLNPFEMILRMQCPDSACLFSLCVYHRDKPRVRTPAKMFPHLKLIYFIISVYGPHSYFWHKAKKQFLDAVFTIKTKFWQYYFEWNMRKNTLFDQFLVLLGPIICMFKWGKEIKSKHWNTRTLVLSLWCIQAAQIITIRVPIIC